MDIQIFLLGFVLGTMLTIIITFVLQRRVSQSSEAVLGPLKEKIAEFQEKVEKTYSEEARERFALKGEITKIIETNLQMGEDAKNLTLALKGDSKVAGNWGEVVLERLLEASGLRSGIEFITQSKSLKLSSDDGKTYRPDVVVLLPKEGHIVLDSKVSLKSYEAFTHSKEDDDLKDFRQSITRHIDDLSLKAYQKLEGLNTPDFVIMFIPVEGAYQLALQSDARLFEYAWKKNIVFAGPSTLFVMLKTINSLWNVEKQGKNAEEIARKSGLLYDKFVLLYEDLMKVGESFTRTQNLFDKTLNRLQDGKGSLVSRVEELKELGANAQKELPKNEGEDNVQNLS